MLGAARDQGGAAAPTVLWLSEYGGSYGGLAVAGVRSLDRHCRERGWRLECGYTPVARGRPWLEDLAEAEIPVEIAPEGRSAKASWLGRKLDGLPGPAIVHTHFSGFDLAALAATRSRPATTAIWHVHSFLRREPVHLARSVLKYGWLSRHGVARIVCVSEIAADSIRRRGGPADRTLVLENGIEVARFTPTTPDRRSQARAALGVEGDDPVLLHFGWDWEVKGGALFMEALARLRTIVPARGVVIGGGAEFPAAAERLRIADALVLAEPSEDVRRFYDAADLLLATSPAEGGGPPLAVLEALSCGTGVIATDIAGHRTGGTAPRALRLVSADPDRIAAAAVTALRAERDGTEAAEAREWVVRERNLDDWVGRMAEIYAAALAEL